MSKTDSLKKNQLSLNVNLPLTFQKVNVNFNFNDKMSREHIINWFYIFISLPDTEISLFS